MGLADSHGFGLLPPREAMPKAKAAAVEALGIDDTLAEAHATLGLVRSIYEGEWPEAEGHSTPATGISGGPMSRSRCFRKPWRPSRKRARFPAAAR